MEETMATGRMTERQAIMIATVLGGVVLVLLLILLHPFSWGSKTKVAVSGTAVSGDAISGTAVSGSAVSGGSVKGTVMTVGTGEIMNPQGQELITRINPPKGYSRTTEKENSFAAFVRNYKLKKDGAKVKLYDGSDKSNQDAHVAVFKLPLEKENLQQCADSIVRFYAEYMWSTEQYDKITFHFVDGFAAQYSRWRAGVRIQVGANGAAWTNGGAADESYEAFKKYLRMVFAYSSTLSLKKECKKVDLADMEIGDIFLQEGAPGHAAMVVDMCENPEGRKAFLLAQGYMPAQQFHVLKNPAHPEDPWYYVDEITYPFETPEYKFGKKTLMRPQYLSGAEEEQR